MSALSLRRLDILRTLSSRLAGESSGGVIGDALELLLAGCQARAGAAFAAHGGPEPLAERGIDGDERSRMRLRRVLATVARRVISGRRRMRSLASPQQLDFEEDAGEFVASELELAGFRGLIAMPIDHRRSMLGVLVVLFEEPRALNVDTERFCETTAHLLAVALERDRRIESEREQRDELEQAGRMASLGVLTATVAHELRGPVGALVLQLEEQKRLIEQLALLAGPADTALGGTGAELAELTSDIDAAVRRVRDTVDQLSTLSRRDTAPEPLDLAHVVHDGLAVARPHLERRGIALIEDTQVGCFTKGRRDNLGQVVLNLVLNAADACERSPHPHVQVSTREQGDQVLLIVDDNGPGIADEAVKTIFRPFYTTKQRGQAAGLGLKICSDVVTQHGGHIEVSARPGGGASFRVVLPKTTDSSGVHPVAQQHSTEARTELVARRRILVVDDDAVFSRTLRRALKPHDVRVALTASEAEIALLDSDYEPDLVLCDVFLPGANGNVLHARIAERRPETARRFCFVTGGGLGKFEADYLRGSGCRTLLKPLDIKDIIEMLETRQPDSVKPLSVRTLSAEPQAATLSSSLPPTPRR